MKEAKGSTVEKVQSPNRRRRKWRIALVATLVAAAIAAVMFYFRQPGLNKQLRVLAGESGAYREEVRGPRWYVKLAYKYKLPVLKRPVAFCSSLPLTDEDMAVVGRAITLRQVDLYGPEVNDAGMAHLEGLTKMQSLGLTSTNIGDDGLAHLSGLTKLRGLNLSYTKVSDEGLVHLKGLTKLQSLRLENINIEGAGLAHLSGLTELRRLYLRGTKVSDTGLVYLKETQEPGQAGTQ